MSVEHLKWLRNMTVLKKLLKFEIYLQIKTCNKILINIKKISKHLMDFINFIKICLSFEQFK